MPPNGIPYFVFTHDPSDRESAKLAEQIYNRALGIMPSPVEGSYPELRTGVHDFVRGIRKIREFLNTEFKLEPQL